jgi:hypothetical protein
MAEEKKDSGFVVKDKRIFAEGNEAGEKESASPRAMIIRRSILLILFYLSPLPLFSISVIFPIPPPAKRKRIYWLPSKPLICLI